MTDHDNLRDRIAELIDPNAWKMHRIPEMPGWTESTELIEPSREKAQAIIDELGLHVERQMGAYGDDPIWEERVVGKWEAEQ